MLLWSRQSSGHNSGRMSLKMILWTVKTWGGHRKSFHVDEIV